MTRQSSETGRHLLSEPGTPLSPPVHGDVFFPIEGRTQQGFTHTHIESLQKDHKYSYWLLMYIIQNEQQIGSTPFLTITTTQKELALSSVFSQSHIFALHKNRVLRTAISKCFSHSGKAWWNVTSFFLLLCWNILYWVQTLMERCSRSYAKLHACTLKPMCLMWGSGWISFPRTTETSSWTLPSHKFFPCRTRESFTTYKHSHLTLMTRFSSSLRLNLKQYQNISYSQGLSLWRFSTYCQAPAQTFQAYRGGLSHFLAARPIMVQSSGQKHWFTENPPPTISCHWP